MQFRDRVLSSFILAAVVSTPFVQCGGDPEGAPPQEADAAPDARQKPPIVPGDSEDEVVPEPSDEGMRTEGGGTRFTPLYARRSYSDGTEEKRFAAFHDRLLGTPCWVDEVGPDVYTCVPFMSAGEEAFSDPGCTEPVIALPFDTGQKFAELSDSTRCARKIVKLGKLTAGKSYRRTSGGGCLVLYENGVSTPRTDPVELFSFGTFTRTKETTSFPRERSGSRLALESWRLSGDDGSFEVPAPRIVDLARSSEGTIFRGMDQKLRFFPALNRLYDPPGYFADDTCTTPVVGFEQSSTSCHADPFQAKNAWRSESIAPGCGGVRVVSPPAAPPVSVVYRNEEGTCGAVDTSLTTAGVHALSSVTTISEDTLVEITRKIVPSTRWTISGTELEARAEVHSSADGLEVQDRTSKLYLRKYGVPCVPTRLGDEATERCLPDGPWDQGHGAYFADAACTAPLLYLINAPSCGASAPLYRSSTPAGDRFFKYPSTPPLVTETVYFKEQSGECRALAAGYGITYIPRGTPEEVPLSDFPIVTSDELVLGD